MLKPINIIVIAIFFILGLFSFVFSEESITITTYYPSPYGSYKELYISDKVGIGTTAPGYTLSVAGVIHGQATANSGDVLRIGNDTKLVDIDVANTAGLYGLQDSTIASLKLGSGGGTISGYSGNVGIGTTPTATLDVNGNTVLRGVSLLVGGTDTDYPQIYQGLYVDPDNPGQAYGTGGNWSGTTYINHPWSHGFNWYLKRGDVSGDYKQGMKLDGAGNLTVYGALTKGSGTFDIPYPEPNKEKEGWRLRHSFVESPTRGDNLYRWQVNVENGQAEIELPDYFKHLNENVQVWVSPVRHFGRAYAKANQAMTKIYVKAEEDGIYNVLAVGTRKDKTAKEGFDI